MGLSNVVAICIIIAAAATLHPQGVTTIESAAQAAEALRRLAGPLTFVVFAVGIIGTGLLTLPVLAASAAYAVGELAVVARRPEAAARRREGLLRGHRGRHAARVSA